MAIVNLDEFFAAQKQILVINKTASLTTVAANFGDPIAVAGNPGAGVLAGTSTAAGIVPTDATAGFPVINAFVNGAQGYITGVTFANSVASRLRLSDCLFKAGAFAYNANITLASQPSFSGRVPGGIDFKGIEIWVEAVTAFTGNLSINIQYTNHEGLAGQTTGTVATGIAPIIGRMIQVPLAAGDRGVRMIERVTATVSTAGTFNVLLLRPLWEGNVRVANGGDSHDMVRTGMPEVFDSSAILLTVAADSTSTGVPYVLFEITSK